MNDIHVISYDSLFSGTLIIKYLINVATEHYLENVFSDTYAERRHKSACESVQSEQTFFFCSDEETLHPWLSKMRPVEFPIR